MVKFEIRGIEFNEMEKKVVDVLAAKGPMKSWRLSKEVNRSWHHTLYILRCLVDRGLIRRSSSLYIVQERIKEILEAK